MLNTTNNNSENLHNYIIKVVNRELKKSDNISDIYKGTIIAASSGIYTVTLSQSDEGSSISAVPMNMEDNYKKDDYVYLLKAESGTTVDYIIFGRVDAVQETFFNLTDAERSFAEETEETLSTL